MRVSHRGITNADSAQNVSQTENTWPTFFAFLFTYSITENFALRTNFLAKLMKYYVVYVMYLYVFMYYRFFSGLGLPVYVPGSDSLSEHFKADFE